MGLRRFFACGILAAVVVGGLAPSPASAAFYWGWGTLSSEPSICFVGDALADRPDRVAQILEYISEFERVANIRFDYLGTCPAPIVGGDGIPWHGGDIRVYIPNAGIPWNIPVPGNGCTIGFVNSSFGREPAFLESDRPCLYNLKLGDDGDVHGVPWRAHTLHEVGHSLGLAHEHQRPDALDPNTCVPKASSCPMPADPVNSALCMTGYDRDSVMNYVISACGIDGNYSQSGLSNLDKLGLHILYPEQNRAVEIRGNKVIRTTETLSLWSSWESRGAVMSAVAKNFDWRLAGVSYSTGTFLDRSFGEGAYPLTVSHQDFLGRSYAYSRTVHVLTSDEFDSTIAASAAIVLVPEPGAALASGVALGTLAALAGMGRAHRYSRKKSRAAPAACSSSLPA